MRHDYDILALDLDEWMPSTLEQAVTLRQIAVHLGVSTTAARIAIHHHRRWFSTDTLGLLCEPRPGPHLYWLSRDPEELKSYELRRSGDSETRLRTIHAIAERGVFHSDGRTLEGRRQRKIQKYLQRLLEDLDELLEES